MENVVIYKGYKYDLLIWDYHPYLESSEAV